MGAFPCLKQFIFLKSCGASHQMAIVKLENKARTWPALQARQLQACVSYSSERHSQCG
jgi:hypothetical protein